MAGILCRQRFAGFKDCEYLQHKGPGPYDCVGVLVTCPPNVIQSFM